MAAKRKSAARTSNKAVTARKTSVRKSPSRSKKIEKSVSLSDSKWWSKYTYTPYEFITKVVLFGLLVFIVIEKRGLVVAATVNGTPISRISVLRDAEDQLGSQILENNINQELIRQKAKEAHITVTQEEVDAKVSEIEQSISSSGQSLDALLALQGMTREVLNDQLKTQVMLETLLSGDIIVSDEDVDKYIEDNADFLPKDDSITEEALKAQIKEQLKQEKVGTRYSTWLQEVKDESDIRYYVDYGQN